jgi:hypothetical protein
MKKAAHIAVCLKTILFVFAIIMVACAPGTNADIQENLTPDEAKSIAREAFLWGMHPVAIYHLRYNYA